MAGVGFKIWPSDSRSQRPRTTATVPQKSALEVEEREIHGEAAWLHKGRADEAFELGLPGYEEVKREGRREHGQSKAGGWERTGGFRPGRGQASG